jgi:hypothetical protein
MRQRNILSNGAIGIRSQLVFGTHFSVLSVWWYPSKQLGRGIGRAPPIRIPPSAVHVQAVCKLYHLDDDCAWLRN